MRGRVEAPVVAFGLAILLVLGGAPAWAAGTIDIPEPRDLPDQSNNFNIMIVVSGDILLQPYNEAENVYAKLTFSSSSEIAQIQVLDESWDPAAPTPYKSSDGRWNFDVVPPQKNYAARHGRGCLNAVVVTFKTGRKRLVLVAPYAKSIKFLQRPEAHEGVVSVAWGYSDGPLEQSMTTSWKDWWPYTTGPAPSAPASPPGQRAPAQKPVKPGDDKGGKDD